MECGNRLRVGVRAKNAAVSGFFPVGPSKDPTPETGENWPKKGGNYSEKLLRIKFSTRVVIVGTSYRAPNPEKFKIAQK